MVQIKNKQTIDYSFGKAQKNELDTELKNRHKKTLPSRKLL
jgi:hypothetical protein